jgi:hypothetical protein
MEGIRIRRRVRLRIRWTEEVEDLKTMAIGN